MSPSKTVKYIGIKIDENLYWKQHIHDITIKINTVNALLFTTGNQIMQIKSILIFSPI